MITFDKQWVPVLNTLAANGLTHANWHNLNINLGSLHLDRLLMKPGLSLIEELTSLKDYFPWEGKLVLNALLPLDESHTHYVIRSSFDGSKICLKRQTLYELIIKLKPDYVLLPRESAFWLKQLKIQLPLETTPFFAQDEPKECLSGDYGYYLQPSSLERINELITTCATRDVPYYLIGEISFEQIELLSSLSPVIIESDLPVKHAMQGLIYDHNGLYNLLDCQNREQFVPLACDCACPPCANGLTRAYLAHLFQQTPLLCQRYLLQHNVFFYQQELQ